MRLIGGRNGASNRPRRAALEHRGNLTRTHGPACKWHAENCDARVQPHRERNPKSKKENQKCQFAALDSARSPAPAAFSFGSPPHPNN